MRLRTFLLLLVKSHKDNFSVKKAKPVTEPPEKVGVCLPRSYQGIVDEARMYKHTHKHTIP
jgi:hypothetical protein